VSAAATKAHHANRIKVALLSDTHGVLDHRIAEVIAGSDWVVHAGDIGNGAVLQQLARLAGQVVAVRGNNDLATSWPLQDHDILTALGWERRIALPGGELVVLHGHTINPASKRHHRLRERYPEARAVVYGHSHRLVEDLGDNPWVLNPGAAGRARTYGGPSCLLLHIKGEQWSLQHQRFEPKGKA
jgi:putative phosphoesterase